MINNIDPSTSIHLVKILKLIKRKYILKRKYTAQVTDTVIKASKYNTTETKMGHLVASRKSHTKIAGI